MNFQIYLKRRGKWRTFLRQVEQWGLPYVLEIGEVDTSRSPITTAVELGAAPEALVIPPAGEMYWYITLADALGVKRLVAPPPPTLAELESVYRIAVEHGVEVNWLYGSPPLARVIDVETVATVVKPTAARLVYDPARARGMREIYTTLVALSGYLREIYLSNRLGPRGPRLPPFHPSGVINYVEIMQALYLTQWGGRITIRQSPEYFPELELQLQIAREVMETVKAAGPSRKVQKRLAAIYNDLSI